jgi:hypothetical protein
MTLSIDACLTVATLTTATGSVSLSAEAHPEIIARRIAVGTSRVASFAWSGIF